MPKHIVPDGEIATILHDGIMQYQGGGSPHHLWYYGMVDLMLVLTDISHMRILP